MQRVEKRERASKNRRWDILVPGHVINGSRDTLVPLTTNTKWPRIRSFERLLKMGKKEQKQTSDSKQD